MLQSLMAGQMQQVEKAAAVLTRQRELVQQKEQQISDLNGVIAGFTNRLRRSSLQGSARSSSSTSKAMNIEAPS